jgi:hypothetical protein
MIRRIETAPQRVNPMGGVGGVVVDEDGGKGKGREQDADARHYGEKEGQYDHGEEVHQIATGSSGSGSRTRYDGNSLSDPESQARLDTPRTRMDVDDTSNDTSNNLTRSRNGTISTPTRPGYDVGPPSANLSPPVPTGLNPPPFMESPGEMSDDGSGILRRIETDKDGDTFTDEDTGTHTGRFVSSAPTA